MVDTGIYKLKEELFPLLKISTSQYDRRREELMEWLAEFYDYEILEGKPIRIKINEIYGEYKPLPRSLKISKQKQEDYNEYVKTHLSKEFTVESKAHMARNAIADFAMEKYNHTSDAAVARRYVGPAMEEFGEKSSHYFWVKYDTYEKLTQEELNNWYNILEEEHIGEKEAANAFYRQEQGEDITKEKNAYKAALKKFEKEYKTIPVRVGEWKLGQ